MPAATTTAVVTSRLPRLIAIDDTWLVALRGTLRRLKPESTRLLIGHHTAGSEFIRHAAHRLQIPFEQIGPSQGPSPDDGSPPERDRVVIESAERIFVLTLRTGGNLHQLLRQRLQRGGGSVILVDLPDLQSESARRELCELGATTWTPSQQECRPLETPGVAYRQCGAVSSALSQDVLEIVPFPDADHWQYLTHTTRACPGAWPGESFEAYADSLLEAQSHADHSPLGALRRIIAQRRLIASSRTIRGGYPVVSLTSCPLERLPSLHQFRPHRVRWDFEPYGLCLKRDWLCRHGARPVSYGDESQWETLSDQDRPFFQLAIGATGIDWSVEAEWRHLGNLALDELTPQDILVFVPDIAAARSIATLSDWPITLWPR